MKTPPDLRQEALISVVNGNWESGGTAQRKSALSPRSKQLKSVSATKNRQETACRTHERSTGRNLVAHSSLPLMGINEYPPGRNLRGKWVLHAQMSCK